MNGRRLILAAPCLASLLVAVPAFGDEERNERIVERTETVERTEYEQPAPYHAGWIAEHNYNHRLRLEREERASAGRYPRRRLDRQGD